jgi:hypothetical protein
MSIPFAQLLRMTHPLFKGRMWALMYRAYLDESAENDDAVFSVGGFCGREEEWEAIQPLWLDALPKTIEYFHSTDCFGGRNQFRNMDIPERVALLDRLTDIIISQKIYLVAGVMDVPAYVRFSPKTLDNEFWGNKYAAAFGVPVEYTCQLQNNPANPYPEPGGELCAFFIEENEYSPSALRTLHSMKNDDRLWWHERIGNLTPGPKKGPSAIPLLQVGDLGAFIAAKRVANAKDGRISWKAYYDKLVEARRIFKIVHVDKKSINTLHKLYEELQREQAEGRSIWDDL